MNEKDIVTAMRASIDNYEKCSDSGENKRGFIYKVKYFVWFMMLILFSPKHRATGKRFAACITPINEIRIHEFAPDVPLYRFARLNDSFSKIKRNISVVSDLTRKQRMKLIIKSSGFYIRNRFALKGYFHFVLEYYAIASFLARNMFEEYITPSMYDRYSTLLSYLGRIHGVKLIGIQDGAAVSIEVPAKIYCDEMHSFDAYEANILMRFIKNDDCKFIYTGFKSVLQWSHFNKTNRKVMAIASQDWFTNTTIQLVNRIMQAPLTDNWDIILLPHYRESVESYKQLIRDYPDLIVEPEKRYDNIDLLITYYSTIAYDFWSVNQDLQVYCLEIPGHIPSYYGRTNVKVFHTIDEMLSSISGISFN